MRNVVVTGCPSGIRDVAELHEMGYVDYQSYQEAPQ